MIRVADVRFDLFDELRDETLLSRVRIDFWIVDDRFEWRFAFGLEVSCNFSHLH